MAQKRGSFGGDWQSKTQRWAGLCLVALGVFFLAALLTFDPAAYRGSWERGEVFFPFSAQLVVFSTRPPDLASGPLAALYHNAGGGLGMWLVVGGLRSLGWIGVLLIPGSLLAWGWNRLLQRPSRSLWWRFLASFPLLATVTAGVAALGASPGWTGAVGSGLWQVIGSAVGHLGGLLGLAVCAIGFFFLEAEAWDSRRGRVTRAVFSRIGGSLRFLGRSGLQGLRVVWSWVRGRPWEKGALGTEDDRPRMAVGKAPGDSAKDEFDPDWTPRIVNHEAEERAARGSEPEPRRSVPSPLPPPVRSPARARTGMPAPRPASAHPGATAAPPAPAVAMKDDPVIRRDSPGIQEPVDLGVAVQEARRHARPGTALRPSILTAVQGKMKLPPLDILDDVPDTGAPVPEEELKENSQLLTQTLRDFGVLGKVGEVHPGPVITRYEYIPGPGVRVSQILNRQDDLALKLRASRIRILAPIPGKAAVGIEVPNRRPAPIFLRRLLETRAFQSATGPLPLVLGKNIGGAPVTAELSRMPHLMIAGTTGSGKSVCINALITSLLVKRTPAELRMIMIDPKMLELPMYNGIPHLLTEVVTDPKVAVRTLKWSLLEMEKRYKLLAARGCRSLQSYNSKMDREGPLQEGEEKLPYIVILIDELADLMITSGKEVEEPVARIAQLARAVGIHLILATQRPSVDVITGVIKANFPCRIAFQVASRTDSRTILDQNGAESLLGKGDMLFLPPGQAAAHRVHGAFVSEEETQRLAKAWRDQGEPSACPGLEEVLAQPEIGTGGLGDDPLFEEAARMVVIMGQASASLLQRRLKVGYARAARLVDMMEAAGVVSTQDGSKAREVLVDEVRLEHLLAGAER